MNGEGEEDGVVTGAEEEDEEVNEKRDREVNGEGEEDGEATMAEEDDGK